jgi:hypothetical protein
MASDIVGTAIGSGQKVLRKSQRATEVDGLVTLTETYIIRTADIATIEPDRNTLHSAFSSASVKYTRMSVETTRVEPMDGDLSTLVVNYVGLDYATGLPPAFITAVGRAGAGIFGADAVVVAKYLTDASLFDTLKGQNFQVNIGESSLTLPTKRLMPSSINGTIMPPNPLARQFRRSPNQTEQFEAAAQAVAEFNRSVPLSGTLVRPISGSFAGPINFAPQYNWIYAGYVQTTISFQRRGLFNQIEEEFSEYFNGSSIFYDASGIPNIDRISKFKTPHIFYF